MIACGTIAFHMYKDDFPTAIMLFHCCYPAILLEYPVVVDHYYLWILYKNIVKMTVILVMEVYNVIIYFKGSC